MHWVRVFSSRAQLLLQPAQSEIWAEEAQPGKETKAALMRGQRSFWVKYSAIVYMISTLPREKRDRDKNAGLIKTNTHSVKQLYIIRCFCAYSFFLEGFTIQHNLEKLQQETASSGGNTISPSTNSKDQSL